MNNPNTQLPRTMSAVVCRGPRDYRLEEWAVPRPGPGEIVVRVHSVGICASDLKCYLGAPLFWGDANRVGYCQPPVIPGDLGVVLPAEGKHDRDDECPCDIRDWVQARPVSTDGNQRKEDAHRENVCVVIAERGLLARLVLLDAQY